MENINLIRKIAWSFHRTTGLPFEDLFSEASLGYCEAVRTYNEKKTTISTWAWRNMQAKIIDYCKKEYSWKKRFLLDENIQEYNIFEETDNLNENRFAGLSYDCMEVVSISLDNLKTNVEQPTSYILWKTRDTLRNRGWTYSRIWKTLRELKQVKNLQY